MTSKTMRTLSLELKEARREDGSWDLERVQGLRKEYRALGLPVTWSWLGSEMDRLELLIREHRHV